jgi:hypothetical protein
MLNISEMRRRFSARRAGTPVLERQMKRSLAWSSLIGVVLYAVSTWLSADGVLVLGTALAAERASLSGDELRKAVSGKTVYLRISGFELPIRYSPGGSMSGRMGAVAATLARGDGASDRGKWWVSGSQLCQQWTSWMEGKSYCYTLTRRGHSVSWVRNDGRSGSARIG